MEWVNEADIFVVIGTSLAVYPAAGLMQCVRHGVPVYYIDPNPAASATMTPRSDNNQGHRHRGYEKIDRIIEKQTLKIV